MSAASRSFHTHRNWKMASDANAGAEVGMAMRKNAWSGVAPSSSAASKSSAGSDTKKLRSK
jgi:hypothetical protein